MLALRHGADLSLLLAYWCAAIPISVHGSIVSSSRTHGGQIAFPSPRASLSHRRKRGEGVTTLNYPHCREPVRNYVGENTSESNA
jgi:hypothetical protein